MKIEASCKSRPMCTYFIKEAQGILDLSHQITARITEMPDLAIFIGPSPETFKADEILYLPRRKTTSSYRQN